MNSPMIYEVRTPSPIEPGKMYPALFLMHGIGSNEQDLLGLVEGLSESMYVFSVRGHLTYGFGFAFFTMHGFGNPDRTTFDEGVRRVTEFIDYACEKYAVDPKRIYIGGFSQGSILAMTLALKLGVQRIRGLAAFSGYIPGFVKEGSELQSVQDLSAFVSHGELDDVLPFEGGAEAAEFLKTQGADVAFHAYRSGHTVSLENLRDFEYWIMKELSHGGR